LKEEEYSEENGKLKSDVDKGKPFLTLLMTTQRHS